MSNYQFRGKTRIGATHFTTYMKMEDERNKIRYNFNRDTEMFGKAGTFRKRHP